MPRPVRKTPAREAAVEKDKVAVDKENIKEPTEEPKSLETGLLTPIRTSTPRYGRRTSTPYHHRRLSFISASPGKKGLEGFGETLSFDGLIDGVSPIKKGDAPHDELTPPPVEEEEEEEEKEEEEESSSEDDGFDLDAFVATKYRQNTMPDKSFVDLLGGAEAGLALPKRNRTQSISPTSSAKKKTTRKAQKKTNAAPPKRKAATKTTTTPAAKKRKR
ncbi:hypothetical protein IW138_006337 [Coemansia sp. RSA 986]|nr:hypothetical protein IW138_006337 [Coemansia sp. RSA 986]